MSAGEALDGVDSARGAFESVDPFDLPEWLGVTPVAWHSESGLVGEVLVRGCLVAETGQRQTLDLLAVDAAYPRIVCPARQRHDAHQAWHFGEVLLAKSAGRLLAAVPATAFDADLVCAAIARVARAIGADAHRFQVVITL